MSISYKAGAVNGLVGGWIFHRGSSGLTGLFSTKGWTWEGKGAQTSGEWYLNQEDGKAYWMGPPQSEYPRISDSRFTPVELSLGGDKKIVWKPFFPVFSRGPSPNHMAAAYQGGPTTPPRYNVTTSVMGYPPNQYSMSPPNPYGLGSARSYGQGALNPTYAGPGSAGSYGQGALNPTYAGPGSAGSYGQGSQRNTTYAGPGSAAAYRGGAKKRRNTRRKQKKTRSKSKRRTSRA
jgi:hypothetical protein